MRELEWRDFGAVFLTDNRSGKVRLVRVNDALDGQSRETVVRVRKIKFFSLFIFFLSRSKEEACQSFLVQLLALISANELKQGERDDGRQTCALSRNHQGN